MSHTTTSFGSNGLSKVTPSNDLKSGAQYIESNFAAIDTALTAKGTVKSVAMTVPSSLLTLGGSPITTSGTLSLTLATQSAHAVLIGPTSGSAAPTFRALAAADIPLALTTSSITASGEFNLTNNAGNINIDPFVNLNLQPNEQINLTAGTGINLTANGGDIDADRAAIITPILTDALNRVIKRESKALQAAAGKHLADDDVQSFRSWFAKWQHEHRAHVADVLQPVTSAAAALKLDITADMIDAYHDATREAVEQIIRTAPRERADKLQSIIDGWLKDRAAETSKSILGDHKHAA